MSKKQRRFMAAVCAAGPFDRIESADFPVAPADAVNLLLSDPGVLAPSQRTSALREAVTPLADAEIAERADSYWQSRGCQGGSAEEDWQCALTDNARERDMARSAAEPLGNPST